MKRALTFAAMAAALAVPALAQNPAQGQPQQPAPPAAPPRPWTTGDAVLRAIWDEGMNRSQLEVLGQALMDSIGPRLTGSPGQQSAHDWAVARYRSWGIDARTQPYGTWRGWRRGYTHIDLLEPRVRTLEGQMLAWSPGTNGPVTAGVVVLPEVADSAAFE
ncbi:MAG TPA: hypothetical protein VFQ39_09590, partial [Longimicrobium sp.]|nr:hypothetical protein [Longimicrobium sp.]